MKNSVVNISISSNVLAELIESESIHAVDFKCLDIASKKMVWKLFLASVKLTQKGQSLAQENDFVRNR